MKRLTAIFLSAVLLLALCACGAPDSASASSQEGQSASALSMDIAPAEENAAGYVVPAAWTESSINDGTWGYVTAAAELPADNGYRLQSGYLVSQETDQETNIITISLHPGRHGALPRSG